jgi:putative oxidoreductase
MTTLVQRTTKIYTQLATMLGFTQPLALLAARCYVAWAFFAAGLTKLRDWDSTLFLFEEEYSVPFINFELAAYLGTGAELILPVLLVLGIASRLAGLGLGFVNIVAVISLEEIAPAALYVHVIWGILLLQVVLWGAGKISVDAWLAARMKSDSKAK